MKKTSVPPAVPLWTICNGVTLLLCRAIRDSPAAAAGDLLLLTLLSSREGVGFEVAGKPS